MLFLMSEAPTLVQREGEREEARAIARESDRERAIARERERKWGELLGGGPRKAAAWRLGQQHHAQYQQLH